MVLDAFRHDSHTDYPILPFQHNAGRTDIPIVRETAEFPVSAAPTGLVGRQRAIHCALHRIASQSDPLRCEQLVGPVF